ncbi:DNA binding domain-containing protein [Halalkalicoccus jeotgali B3]|uniref:DNA binding domain-containing protein n=2 Tax=Halalkalicoccus jeotgali TaxID=413810 RepID=D8J4E4_HALJB|nr:DNA binding domain-containing protein [Halalkalicoccus jeotgali B3]ELY33019.1 DNA binding domain-containing protein [Halalkalicoccus jeotgali B3]
MELPSEEFALSQTLSRVEDVEFEVERFVAHDDDHVMPFVWVSDGDGDRIRTELEADESVENIELVSELDGEWLFRMEWVDHIETLIHILVKEEGSILAAFGDESGWQIRVLFADRDGLSRTYDYCRDAGLTVDIRSIYQLDDGREGRFGLTDEQQDTLVAAYERGYFDVPRKITLTDLGEELGISHQALSERLRRGEKSVLKNTVIVGAED